MPLPYLEGALQAFVEALNDRGAELRAKLARVLVKPKLVLAGASTM